MLTIDLSTLSAPELKRLIEAARARGQHELVERLTRQLAAAGARPVGWRPTPAYALPHHAAWMDGGDEAPAARGLGGLAHAAVFTVAVALATVGFALDLTPAQTPQRVSRPPVQAALAPPRLNLAVAVSSPAIEAAPVPAEPPRAPPAAPRANPCLGGPTPADRLVCGYPVLAQQDRALKAALERAAAAGADPEALARDQAAWKTDRRDGVSDWQQLAEVYRDRVLEVEAAAMAAETLAGP